MSIYSVFRNGLELGIYESDLSYALKYWSEKTDENNIYTLKKTDIKSFVWPERVK